MLGTSFKKLIILLTKIFETTKVTLIKVFTRSILMKAFVRLILINIFDIFIYILNLPLKLIFKK